MFSGTFGIRSIVLCKCSGKYIGIYFKLKVTYSQLVRFSSVCSKFNDFDIRSRNLLESLLNRGFSKYKLKNSFSKFALNHHDVLDIKYSMEEINEFIRPHFS